MIGAFIATALLGVSLFLVSIGECVSENSDLPASWPWSPRRQFCSGGGHAALGGLALLLAPTVLIATSALLTRGHWRRTAVWCAVVTSVILALPLPRLYISSLPLYRLDSYPILHDPLLRPAAGGVRARICYAYGIVDGPRKAPVTADTPRACIEMVDTPQARVLTTAYDEGRTIYELEWVGKNLTARGLPRRGETGVNGLVVTNAYELPGPAAAAGASRLDGAI